MHILEVRPRFVDLPDFLRAMNPLERAVLLLGSDSALARACGLTKNSIPPWRRRAKVPCAHHLTIARAVEGLVHPLEFQLWETGCTDTHGAVLAELDGGSQGARTPKNTGR